MSDPLEHEVGETITAYDAAAEAMGYSPWQMAEVTGHLYEDGLWWYEVRFCDGGRSSILRPKGVQSK